MLQNKLAGSKSIEKSALIKVIEHSLEGEWQLMMRY